MFARVKERFAFVVALWLFISQNFFLKKVHWHIIIVHVHVYIVVTVVAATYDNYMLVLLLQCNLLCSSSLKQPSMLSSSSPSLSLGSDIVDTPLVL